MNLRWLLVVFAGKEPWASQVAMEVSHAPKWLAAHHETEIYQKLYARASSVMLTFVSARSGI